MFENRDQARDLQELWAAMDDMPETPVCQSFPEAYFPTHESPIHGEEAMWAKAMCAECPVKKLCAEFAIKWDQTGIWGGTSHRERTQIRKARGIKKGTLHAVPGLAD